IPGLPGVGEKTAKKFLKEFGSMENLLANTTQLKGKMKEKVEANAELGLLSKDLARIMLDVPVEFHEQDFELNTPDLPKVQEIFQELEFRRLAENLMKTFQQNSSTQTAVSDTPKPTASGADHQFDLFSDLSNNENTGTST